MRSEWHRPNTSDVIVLLLDFLPSKWKYLAEFNAREGMDTYASKRLL